MSAKMVPPIQIEFSHILCVDAQIENKRSLLTLILSGGRGMTETCLLIRLIYEAKKAN